MSGRRGRCSTTAFAAICSPKGPSPTTAPVASARDGRACRACPRVSPTGSTNMSATAAASCRAASASGWSWRAALLRRPSLLILDEATAALDPDGEAAADRAAQGARAAPRRAGRRPPRIDARPLRFACSRSNMGAELAATESIFARETTSRPVHAAVLGKPSRSCDDEAIGKKMLMIGAVALVAAAGFATAAYAQRARTSRRPRAGTMRSRTASACPRAIA